MTQKEFLYLLLGAGLGFSITYFYHKSVCGNDSTGVVTREQCCAAPFASLCNFFQIDSPPNPVENDAQLRGYFQNYSGATGVSDAYGFSLDRSVIAYAAQRCVENDQLAGFRFYPGKDGSQNLVLIIGLRRNGTEAYLRELPGSGAKINYNSSLKGHGGPCPDWCERLEPGARVIY